MPRAAASHSPRRCARSASSRSTTAATRAGWSRRDRSGPRRCRAPRRIARRDDARDPRARDLRPPQRGLAGAAVIDRIRAEAARRGESLAEAVRHHLLGGVIERVARTTDDLVLRGGMLTRAWIDPAYRPTRDLDFVGDFAFDLETTHARFATALAVELPDEIVVDALTAEGIWLDTAFPGVRLRLAIGL